MAGTTVKMLAVAGAMAAAVSCAPLEGAVGGIPSGRASLVSGEIRSVDSRRGQVQLRSDYGRTHSVRYDNRTRVVYRSRSYPVSALERGDLVRVTVRRDARGNTWADRIDVRESVRDRRNVGGRVERLDGTVGRVDVRRGVFSLERRGSPTMLVQVTNRSSRSDIRRFERLRRGERVRVEVRSWSRTSAELVRFR